MYSHRIAAAVVVACGAGVLLTSPSLAGSVADPCVGMTIRDVVVSGDAWLVQCWSSSGPVPVFSTDGGQTWRAPASGFSGNGRVAPDGQGNFYLSIGPGTFGGGEVSRLTAATGAVERHNVAGAAFNGGLAIDPSGGVWAPSTDRGYCAFGTAGLIKIDLSANTATTVASGPCSGKGYDDPLRLDANGSPYLIDSPDTRLVPVDGQLVGTPLTPIASSGGALVTEGGVTGAGWNYRGDMWSVPGEPDFINDSESGLLQRIGDTGAWVRTGRSFAAATARGVLVPSEDGQHLELVTGPLTAAVTDVGDPQPADSAQMIDEANRMRAEVGLPPLIGDAKIAQAAHNHSAYWTLNDPTGVGLGLHRENFGNPGFTGRTPAERCAAVGASCGGEVMYEGLSGAEAVQGWIATAFHRAFIMLPSASRVGAGAAPGGPATMDAGSAPTFVGVPFGYPRGMYSGPLSFDGEIPDPGQSCQAGSVSAPYGTAITVAKPGGVYTGPDWSLQFPDAIALREQGASALLGGCLLENQEGGLATFLPDEPLKAGTAYVVSASWSGRHPDLTWSFTTSGARDETPNVTPSKKKIRIALTKRGRNRLRVDASPDGPQVTYRTVLQRRNRKHWRAFRTLNLKSPSHMKTLRTKRGAYRVIASQQAGMRGAKSRVVTVK